MTKFEKIKATKVAECKAQIKLYEEILMEWNNKTLEEFVANRIYENKGKYVLILSSESEQTVTMRDYDKLVEIGKIYFSQEEVVGCLFE